LRKSEITTEVRKDDKQHQKREKLKLERSEKMLLFEFIAVPKTCLRIMGVGQKQPRIV